MLKLSEQEIEPIVRLFKDGKPYLEDYKAVLFDNKKEYERIYAGKEREDDILADIMAVPLQPVKTFQNGQNGDGWKNPVGYDVSLLDTTLPNGIIPWRKMLIFGDNVQTLRSNDLSKDQ